MHLTALCSPLYPSFRESAQFTSWIRRYKLSVPQSSALRPGAIIEQRLPPFQFPEYKVGYSLAPLLPKRASRLHQFWYSVDAWLHCDKAFCSNSHMLSRFPDQAHIDQCSNILNIMPWVTYSLDPPQVSSTSPFYPFAEPLPSLTPSFRSAFNIFFYDRNVYFQRSLPTSPQKSCLQLIPRSVVTYIAKSAFVVYHLILLRQDDSDLR